jgi:putative FmdB family regulatory protein
MPVYEYGCRVCGRRFTEYSRKVVSSDEEKRCPPCPACLSSDTHRLVGSFIVQGSGPGHPLEAGYHNETQEREMQMTPREHIEEYRKMANPQQK